jgi:hypothetical protein
MAGRKIALIVTTTNHWDTIKANPAGVTAACAEAGPGRTIDVPFPKPPDRRRRLRARLNKAARCLSGQLRRDTGTVDGLSCRRPMTER